MWQFSSLLVEKLAHGLIPARLASFLAVGGLGFGVHMAILYTGLALGAPFWFDLLNNLLKLNPRIVGAKPLTGLEMRAAVVKAETP